MNKKSVKNVMLCFVIAFMITFFLKCYAGLVENLSEMLKIDSIVNIFKEKNTYFIFAFFFFAIIAMKQYHNVIGSFLYKYRYLCAFGLFIICIIFEITGSSIGMWCSYIGEIDQDLICGVSRAIRTDEWAVSTPMLCSQYYNYPETFSYYSNTVRACPTDVFLEYGQPVKNIMMIFRPFYLGYLFLPLAKGMAFFWCGRWIALFLASFEFGMLITKKKKCLSVIWASMVTFAPVVQWWFAINGFVEMLIYVQVSTVLLWKYMQTDVLWKRTIYVLAIVICAGGFILTFYPSWQIPMGYVLLGLIAWSIIENYKKCKMKLADWGIVLLGIVILIGSMGYLFILSGDTIEAIMGTAYPGSRLETGGGMYQQFYNSMSNVWYAVMGNGTGANVCESSQFIDLFPVSLILPVVVLIKQEKKDKLLIILLVISLFLGIYCSVGFTPALSKILFLSFSQSSRTIIIFQFCNIMLLIRSLSADVESIQNKIGLWIVTLGLTVFYMWNAYHINTTFWGYGMLAVTGVLTVILFLGCFRYSNRIYRYIWGFTMTSVMIVSGLLVNPIRSGIDSVTNRSIIKELKDMKEAEPDAIWIMENQGLPYNNLGLLAGLSTINTTNIYPVIDRWKQLDKGNRYEEIYNRYAHIKMVLADNEEPEFLLESPDAFCVSLNAEALQELNVDYILTNRDLQSENLGVTLVKQVNSYGIYKLNP